MNHVEFVRFIFKGISGVHPVHKEVNNDNRVKDIALPHIFWMQMENKTHKLKKAVTLVTSSLIGVIIYNIAKETIRARVGIPLIVVAAVIYTYVATALNFRIKECSSKQAKLENELSNQPVNSHIKVLDDSDSSDSDFEDSQDGFSKVDNFNSTHSEPQLQTGPADFITPDDGSSETPLAGLDGCSEGTPPNDDDFDFARVESDGESDAIDSSDDEASVSDNETELDTSNRTRRRGFSGSKANKSLVNPNSKVVEALASKSGTNLATASATTQQEQKTDVAIAAEATQADDKDSSSDGSFSEEEIGSGEETGSTLASAFDKALSSSQSALGALKSLENDVNSEATQSD